MQHHDVFTDPFAAVPGNIAEGISPVRSPSSAQPSQSESRPAPTTGTADESTTRPPGIDASGPSTSTTVSTTVQPNLTSLPALNTAALRPRQADPIVTLIPVTTTPGDADGANTPTPGVGDTILSETATTPCTEYHLLSASSTRRVSLSATEKSVFDNGNDCGHVEREVSKLSATGQAALNDRAIIKNPLMGPSTNSSSSSDLDERDPSADQAPLVRGSSVAHLRPDFLVNHMDLDDGVGMEALMSTHSETNSSMSQPETQVCCRVSSLVAVALLMCTGAVVVGLLGFLPLYFIGVKANSVTTEFLLSEAMKGVASITQNSVSMLPAFVHIITFNYIRKQNTTMEDVSLPDNASDLMFSLLTVLTRFKASIQFLTFVSEPDLYTDALYNTNFTQPFGAYSAKASPARRYMINEANVTLVEPLQWNGYTDFPKQLASPEDVMQSIVIPWSRNSSMNTRWLLDLLNTTSTYFNYALPFSIDGALGYCEAGLPSTNIMSETYKLKDALRAHGRIVILDYYRGIVLQNSWGQKTVFSVETDSSDQSVSFAPLYISDIDDPIMKSGVDAVRASGGFKTVMRDTNTSLVRFKFNGNEAYLNLTRLTDNYGLDIVLGVTVLRADFEKAFSTARTVVISVTVGVVVLAAIIAVLIAYLVVKPLKKLVPELQRASALDITNDDGSNSAVGKKDKHQSKPFITEIRDIQEAYRKLKESLKEMKSYVPQAVMTAANDQDSSLTERHAKFGEDDEILLDGDLAMTAGPRRDLRLNTKIFKEQINEFKKKSCTVVYIELRCDPDIDAVRCTIDTITEIVGQYSGCIEQIGLNHILISFGAHASLPFHAAKGCSFVLNFYYRIPKKLRRYIVCLVDNGEFMVGTCGARNRNTRVVFGAGHLLEMSKVMWDIDCHIAAPQGASSHLPPLQSVPVEFMQLQGSKTQVMLCELRPPPPPECVEQMKSDRNLICDGFSFLCNGHCAQAIANFNAVQDKTNEQVHRLIRVAQQRLAAGDTSPYVRPTEDVYHFDYKPADSTAATLADAQGPLEIDREDDGSELAKKVPGHSFNATFPEGVVDYGSPVAVPRDEPLTNSSMPSAAGGAVEPPKETVVSVLADLQKVSARVGTGQLGRDTQAAGSDDQHLVNTPPPADLTAAPERGTATAATDEGSTCSGALFDMMGNSATSSDDVFRTDQRNALDTELALTLVDIDNRTWSRSIKAIGDGAFSVVYLGMSEDGVQVAIKCIPRRRRDIKQEAMESEIHMAATLRHPNIVQYITCSITPTHLSIIMEYVPGGSLYTVIENFGKLSAAVARRFMIDILNGLAYLHTGGIVHCDLKPHNMLLGMDGICKLSDFGSTISEATDMARSSLNQVELRGTAVYMAPEVARGMSPTTQSDIFSLGVSLLEMLLGRLPWRWTELAQAGSDDASLQALSHNDVRFAQALARGELRADIPETLEREVLQFASACCQEDPKKRPTAQELLSFPFVI